MTGHDELGVTALESVYGKAGRHIPKARRVERVWPYLYAFETLKGEQYPEIEKLCRDGLIFGDIESDPELKERMPEGFVHWCCFNLKDDLKELNDALEEKEVWWKIAQARAQGQKLSEIGEWSHLTSERVRQICNLLVARTQQKGGKEIIAKMVACNGRTDCLTRAEMAGFLGRKSGILIYLLTNMLENDPDWYYWPDARTVVLVNGRETAAKTETYVKMLPDIIPHTAFTQIRDAAEKAGYSPDLVEQTIIYSYEFDGFNYHRGAIQTQEICEDIMRTYFKDGIYIYDSESLREFRDRAHEKYGEHCAIPDNDHAMTVLLNRISMLRNRGIYIPVQKGILPEELLERIRQYMRDNGQVSYMYNTLFGAFRQELLKYGVDNRYYLQGVLRQDLGDEFTMTRDYVTTDQSDKQLKDPVIRYIRDAGRMVPKDEIANVFHTSPYLAYNCALMDKKIINYFGQYMHVDNLGLTEQDIADLRSEVDSLLSDGELHGTKELLKNLRRRQPQLVQKAHLDAPYPVFSLVDSLMGDDYVLDRPYMALRDSDGARQLADIKDSSVSRTKMRTNMPKHRKTAGPEEILNTIRESGKEGLTMQELHREYHVTKNYLSGICDHPDIIEIGGRYVSAQNIEDLDHAAEVFYRVIEKELDEYGVIRRGKVCDVLHAELPDFFKKNRLTEPDAPFFMIKYMFQKHSMMGATWYFHPHNRSVSRDEATSDVTLMGQVIAYCRHVQRPVTMDEMSDRLKAMGYNINNLKYNLHLYEDPFLFIYEPNTFVLVESLGITDEWLQSVGEAMKKIFKARGTMIPMMKLKDSWLQNHLPPISMGISWNRYLLQQICCFFGEAVGARTIRPIGMQSFNGLHSFLVPYNSDIQTSTHALWLWLVENGYGGNVYRTGELLELLYREQILEPAENGKVNRINRILTLPSQFKWNAAQTKVTVVPAEA